MCVWVCGGGRSREGGGVAGFEELEGLGRECGSPEKRKALKFSILEIPLSCPTEGGKGFVHVGRCRVSVIRGGRLSRHSNGDFPRVGWGSVTRVVCTVPRLQDCARRFLRKLVASGLSLSVHELTACGHTHCECTHQKQQQ